jgi:hypothetical protein
MEPVLGSSFTPIDKSPFASVASKFFIGLGGCFDIGERDWQYEQELSSRGVGRLQGYNHIHEVDSVFLVCAPRLQGDTHHWLMISGLRHQFETSKQHG